MDPTKGDVVVTGQEGREIAPVAVKLSDVAKMIGVHQRTLWSRVRAGVIPGFRLDRKGEYYIRKEVIEQILAGKFNEAIAFDEVGETPPGTDRELLTRVGAASE